MKINSSTHPNGIPHDMQDQKTLEEAISTAEGDLGLAFVASLHRVKTFLDAHGRLPRSRARGDLIAREELRAGGWVRTVRRRRERLSQDRQDLINLLIPGLLEPEREYLDWEVRLRQVADFRRKHGRLPRFHRFRDPLPGETVLGNWRTELARNRHVLTPEQHALISLHCPTLLADDGRLSWEESLAMYIAFVQEHGRDPRQYTQQDPRGERPLGLWVTKVRSGADKLKPARVQMLKEQAPSLLQRKCPSPRTLDVILGEVQDFIAAHGRWPRSKGRSLIGDEGRLGHWRYMQRRNVSTMDPDRLKTITNALPGMFD